jgi:DNA-binding NtrC family response regulator
MQESQPKTISVLSIITTDEEEETLRGMLTHCRWQLTFVRTWQSAIAQLRLRHFDVVTGDCCLPNGHSWRELLRELQMFSDPPPLVVTSRIADQRLWAEVLSLGGFDLLVKPLDEKEANHVLRQAAQFRRSDALLACQAGPAA